MLINRIIEPPDEANLEEVAVDLPFSTKVSITSCR